MVKYAPRKVYIRKLHLYHFLLYNCSTGGGCFERTEISRLRLQCRKYNKNARLMFF